MIRIVFIANQRRDPDPPRLNQMISEGYWSRLVIAIRRLLDPATINGPKGVYSLRSVLKDIVDCGPKINRRIFVDAIWDADWEQAMEAARSRRGVWGDPRLTNSQMAHEHFDFLSNTMPENRSYGDVLDVSILRKADARLKKLDEIKEHLTVHLAHAGNMTSREGKILDNFGISNARECLKELRESLTLLVCGSAESVAQA